LNKYSDFYAIITIQPIQRCRYSRWKIADIICTVHSIECNGCDHLALLHISTRQRNST